MVMERMKIKNHLSEKCEHTVISCKCLSLGCDVKLKRKDMKAHEQSEYNYEVTGKGSYSLQLLFLPSLLLCCAMHVYYT